MFKKQFSDGLKISGGLINILTVSLGIAAAYFMTIQQLKIEIAEKAEERVVETLDKKLSNLEVIIKEGVLSKEDFYNFSKEVESRLSRIEYYLIDQAGDKIGKNNKLSGSN